MHAYHYDVIGVTPFQLVQAGQDMVAIDAAIGPEIEHYQPPGHILQAERTRHVEPIASGKFERAHGRKDTFGNCPDRSVSIHGTESEQPNIRIALDVMGGDDAPGATLDGARAVRADGSGIDVVLVGPEEIVAGQGFEYVAADQVVTAEDKPSHVMRDKPRSSMRVATELVKDGKVDGAVSAGSTGAFMAIALFSLGRIQGIDRPAFGGIFPTRHGQTFVIDLGANADAKPQYLAQFGLMGSVYMERVFGVAKPRVGLLNIGEEEGKGNQLAQQSFPLLKASPINFIGNIEGNDLPEGHADVVVCDGFTGNVVAKLSEGLAPVLSGWIREEIEKEKLGMLGALLLRPAFRRVRKRLDYAEYGAAPLFGVNGLAVVAHGRSNARAIQQAINIAARAARQNLIHSIQQALADESWPTAGDGVQDQGTG